jgi:hypothetical protein
MAKQEHASIPSNPQQTLMPPLQKPSSPSDHLAILRTDICITLARSTVDPTMMADSATALRESIKSHPMLRPCYTMPPRLVVVDAIDGTRMARRANSSNTTIFH